MKMKDLLFIIGIVAVVAALYLLSTTGRKPPDIPPDVTHAAVTEKEGCLECHAEGKPNPLKKEHPPKDQCFECHDRAEGAG